MEGDGAFLHLASWWCKGTCCRRNGVKTKLSGFFLDMDISIGRKLHSFQC